MKTSGTARATNDTRWVRVAGVDGFSRGWAVAQAEIRSDRCERRDLKPTDIGRLELVAASDFEAIIRELRAGAFDAVAVDMPIGLLATHPRPADVEGRRRLGPRRSSVFPSPVRDVLQSQTYQEANETSKAVAGVGLSRQAFNLLPKIRELDELVTPEDQDRLVEAHPELAFARLAGQPLALPKRVAEGKHLRQGLLAEVFGRRLDEVLESRPVPLDDALDALALILVADRVARSCELRLGTAIDPTGKRAELAI